MASKLLRALRRDRRTRSTTLGGEGLWDDRGRLLLRPASSRCSVTRLGGAPHPLARRPRPALRRALMLEQEHDREDSPASPSACAGSSRTVDDLGRTHQPTSKPRRRSTCHRLLADPELASASSACSRYMLDEDGVPLALRHPERCRRSTSTHPYTFHMPTASDSLVCATRPGESEHLHVRRQLELARPHLVPAQLPPRSRRSRRYASLLRRRAPRSKLPTGSGKRDHPRRPPPAEIAASPRRRSSYADEGRAPRLPRRDERRYAEDRRRGKRPRPLLRVLPRRHRSRARSESSDRLDRPRRGLCGGRGRVQETALRIRLT